MIFHTFSEHSLVLIAALSPALYALAATFSWFQPGMQPRRVIAASKVASIAGLLLAAVSAYLVYDAQLLSSRSFDYMGLGISLRLDPLSVLVFAMINLIAFIVLRFSYNYIDGDARHGVFTGRLAATIASVQLLVLSGNLGLLWFTWMLTSFSLHRLLKFYPGRTRAVIAARKKFITARLSDAFLLGALVLLYRHFGSGNLEVIIEGMRQVSGREMSLHLELAALCIAIAAILKSALFPTHGWLVEVMETPTPVSALLHAGLLNAGPFLVARLAFVVHGSTYGPLVLIIFGGFTALFASVTYLTQTSVKTALGYSSVAHMGFSLLLCGMGLYAAAMLHLVAHSFYKAHAFLSSGSAIDVLKASRISLPSRLHNPWRLLASAALAFAIFAGLAYVWGIILFESISFFAVSAVMAMGVSLMLSKAFDSKGSGQVMVKTALLAGAVGIAFFSLEAAMSKLLGVHVPIIATPGVASILLIAGLLVLFATVVLIQMTASQSPLSPHWQRWAIHVRNGLYTNAWYDRMAGALQQKGRA